MLMCRTHWLQRVSPIYALCNMPAGWPSVAAYQRSASDICRKRCVALPSSRCNECQSGYCFPALDHFSLGKGLLPPAFMSPISKLMWSPTRSSNCQDRGWLLLETAQSMCKSKMADLPGRTQMTVTQEMPSQSGHGVLCGCVPAPRTHAALAPC